VEKNIGYWRVNVRHYGEEMLGKKENKSLLELSQPDMRIVGGTGGMPPEPIAEK
jgi:hypothetical protein